MNKGTGLIGFSVGILLPMLTSPVCVAQLANAPIQEKLHQYRSKIVVLNFWAAWCEPCKRELPLLAELQRQFKARGVQFVGACMDEERDREKAEEFLRKSGVRFPSWFELSEKEMRTLGLGVSIPATAIFDREGKRVFRLIGDVKKKQLVERLEWLLGNQEGRLPKELVLPAGMDKSEYR
jgi:thiol-disulfide isomerase/thioredoxin